MFNIEFHCDEKENFKKGYKARALTYKDYSIEMHTHDFYEVNIVLAGGGTHCIENSRFKATPGDVFVIPPNIAHAYCDTNGLEVYHILLQKSFLSHNSSETKKVEGFLQLTEIEPILRSNFSNSYFLHLNRSQLELFKNETTFLNNSLFPWEENAPMKYHTIWKILFWFSDMLSTQISTNQGYSMQKNESQIIKSLEYLHKNYAEKITIDTLAKEVFLSRSTFLRYFYNICGTSPIEYLNNYRCKKAIELMETKKFSKTEIAHNCGFYDLSHMERMLKKYNI